MNSNFTFLIEKEEMWAKMLIEVLNDNNIPSVSRPVFGAALVIGTGMHERLRIFVPTEFLQQANELVEELFSSDTNNNDLDESDY